MRISGVGGFGRSTHHSAATAELGPKIPAWDHAGSRDEDYPPGCTLRFWYHRQEPRWYDRLRLVGGSPMHTPFRPCHPFMGRRTFLQAGTIGALGLSMTGVASLRGAEPAGPTRAPRY